MTGKGSINPASDSVLSILGWLKIRNSMHLCVRDIPHLQNPGALQNLTFPSRNPISSAFYILEITEV